MDQTRARRCEEILALYDGLCGAGDCLEADCHAYAILGDARALGEPAREYAWQVFEMIDEMYEGHPLSDCEVLLQRQEGAALVFLGRIG